MRVLMTLATPARTNSWPGATVALIVLVAPAATAVIAALAVASTLDPVVTAATDRVVAATATWPMALAAPIAGDYGLATMLPLLVVWALPAAVALALVLGTLTASGALDRLAAAVAPLVRPFGLTGSDLVRVVAGHGCNVPAIAAEGSCGSCSGDAAAGAVAFGSACSYQLAATVAVLAAAGHPALVAPYVVLLLAGGLLHARYLIPARTRRLQQMHDLHRQRRAGPLVRPRWPEVRSEAATTLRHASLQALPVFVGMSVVASVLAVTGVLEAAASLTGPMLAPLRLPSAVAVPVVVGAVRKDGILLMSDPATLAVLDPAQLLAALLLAGAVLPCLVTALTMARQRGPRRAIRLVARQAVVAAALAGTVAWLGRAIVT